METIQIDSQTATVRLTRDDLVLLTNAINEAREALEEWEFATRVGASLQEAEELGAKLGALVDRMPE